MNVVRLLPPAQAPVLLAFREAPIIVASRQGSARSSSAKPARGAFQVSGHSRENRHGATKKLVTKVMQVSRSTAAFLRFMLRAHHGPRHSRRVTAVR